VVRCALAVITLALAQPTRVVAQGGAFLLVPFGARAVGRGESIVADSTLGTESIWWNAAGLARMPKREFAFHNVRSVSGNIFMLAAAAPSVKLGTFAAGAYMFDFGTLFRTDSSNNTTGTITTRNYLLGASYASPVASGSAPG
jgi:hypothetical protein